ncbi:Uncharacterised protein [Legionella pneumophila]|nr:Uncharacterised protein [Legionella pneumophila]
MIKQATTNPKIIGATIPITATRMDSLPVFFKSESDVSRPTIKRRNMTP